jgi:hypothetical protein
VDDRVRRHLLHGGENGGAVQDVHRQGRAGACRSRQPDDLVACRRLLWGLFPPHLGIRQYWRDFATLERWARELPHADWWRNQLADAGGTGFWHETYLLLGGMESVYLDMPPTGFGTFAPAVGARASLFSARRRLQLDAEVDPPSVVTEWEIDE